MIACLSPNGSTLYAGEHGPSRLIVGTVRGVVTAEAATQGFAVVATTLEDCHIASIWFHPERQELFASSYQGGVYWSRDFGESWDDISGPLASQIVYCVAAREFNGSTWLYAGTEPVGLYLSTDHGATWDELPAIRRVPGTEHWTFPAPPHAAHLKTIVFDPAAAEAFYACIEQGGLFQTIDGGQSFRELESVAQPDDVVYKDVHRVVLHPTKPERLWLTSGDGLSVSDDHGGRWRRLCSRSWTIGYPDGLVVSLQDPDRLWLAGAHRNPGSWRQTHQADAHIARSLDGGETWSILHRGLPEPISGNIEALSLYSTHDANHLFFATTDGAVYGSQNDGEQWQCLLEGLAPISKAGHYRPLLRRI